MNETPVDAVEEAEDASTAEVARYEQAFRETRRVLDESIRALMILQEFEEDSARGDNISLNLLALQGRRLDLVRANIAFHAAKATMVPPTRELVSEIIELSKAATRLTVERATAAAILRLATSALKKYAEIQEI